MGTPAACSSRPAAAPAPRASSTTAAWRPGWRLWQSARACPLHAAATCAVHGTAGEAAGGVGGSAQPRCRLPKPTQLAAEWLGRVGLALAPPASLGALIALSHPPINPPTHSPPTISSHHLHPPTSRHPPTRPPSQAAQRAAAAGGAGGLPAAPRCRSTRIASGHSRQLLRCRRPGLLCGLGPGWRLAEVWLGSAATPTQPARLPAPPPSLPTTALLDRLLTAAALPLPLTYCVCVQHIRATHGGTAGTTAAAGGGTPAGAGCCAVHADRRVPKVGSPLCGPAARVWGDGKMPDPALCMLTEGCLRVPLGVVVWWRRGCVCCHVWLFEFPGGVGLFVFCTSALLCPGGGA